MKMFFPATLALLALSVASFAQTPADDVNTVRQFNEKTRHLYFYNLMLPILITKDQFKVILPAIEKARERVRLTYKMERDLMKALEPKIDDSITAAAEKGQVPSAQLLAEVDQLRAKIGMQEFMMAQTNEDDVYQAISKTLNAGQLKAMANSLNPKLLNPNLKPDKMTQEEKLRLFISDVLLSIDYYDDLVKMSLKAS